jgi:hypothetical protein
MKGDYSCEICNLHFDELDAFDNHVKVFHPDWVSPKELLSKAVEKIARGDHGFEFSNN